MNDHPKHNLRLRQTVIVAVCVLAVLLFLYLLLRDRPGSASDYLDDSAPYTFDSSASRTFRTVDSRLAVVSSSGLQLLGRQGRNCHVSILRFVVISQLRRAWLVRHGTHIDQQDFSRHWNPRLARSPLHAGLPPQVQPA